MAPARMINCPEGLDSTHPSTVGASTSSIIPGNVGVNLLSVSNSVLAYDSSASSLAGSATQASQVLTRAVTSTSSDRRLRNSTKTRTRRQTGSEAVELRRRPRVPSGSGQFVSAGSEAEEDEEEAGDDLDADDGEDDGDDEDEGDEDFASDGFEYEDDEEDQEVEDDEMNIPEIARFRNPRCAGKSACRPVGQFRSAKRGRSSSGTGICAESGHSLLRQTPHSQSLATGKRTDSRLKSGIT
ncbi:unnamed protein product [Protopolystoma xenopodis]|uniref:Uncharacterized protein n=1 Tax=Protopolystoma xenopodis TaxID=117903 RepID=A0A448X2C6_9PLAT|nr:unnamed protein product [Protopolystoma xenopodis]